MTMPVGRTVAFTLTRILVGRAALKSLMQSMGTPIATLSSADRSRSASSSFSAATSGKSLWKGSGRGASTGSRGCFATGWYCAESNPLRAPLDGSSPLSHPRTSKAAAHKAATRVMVLS